MADPDLEAGSELLGYRVERLLGRGGMGVVYLCADSRLRRPVALKLLTASLAQDAGFRERFLVEAELAASLDHPHVVPIYEAGDRDGRLFIAMRYVEGSDLRALIRGGPLSAQRTVEVCSQVAGALDFAHERGLVHGDVKPSNVLLDGRGHPYLADFGVSRRLDQPRQSSDPGLSGTIDYVAPELIRGEQLDGRADQYSLGCLLYECLTGEPPFARSTNAAVLFAHLEEPPPARPAGLEHVIGTVLAKTPQERYPTCGEFVAAVADALGIDQHADWGRRALDWDRHGRDRRFLLAGADLEAAELWRQTSADTGFAPTPLQGEFIDASRQAVTRRLRRTRGLVFAAFLVAIGLAVVAFVQRENAISNERAAVANAHKAQSLQLAASAELTLAKDPQLSTLLALQAVRITKTPQATQALRDALQQLRILGTLEPRGYLLGATLSGDGKELLTTNAEGGAQLWSVNRRRRLGTLFAPRGQAILRAAFSPDGKQIVTAGTDYKVRIWSASSYTQLAVLVVPHAGRPPASVAFSPNGREIVAGYYDGTARIWSAISHRQLFALRGPDSHNPVSAVTVAAFSPDGTTIMTASPDRAVRIWGAQSHRQIAVFTIPRPGSTVGIPSGAVSAAFSPDGKDIVTTDSADGTARIWSVTNHQLIVALTAPDGSPLNDAAFSPDGKEIVTASQDGTAQVWSVIDGKRLLVLAGHTAGLETARFSPNGSTVVTASFDGTVKLWNVGVLEQLAVLAAPAGPDPYNGGNQAPLFSAVFSPDGKEIVTAGPDLADARLWSASSQRQLAVLRYYHSVRFAPTAYSGAFDAAFSPDGTKIATAGQDGTVRIWSARTHRQLASLSTGGALWIGAIQTGPSVAFSPNGKEIAWSSGGFGPVRIWDTSTYRQLAVLPEEALSVAFSPNNKEILTSFLGASFTGAQIWSARTHRQLARLPEQRSTDWNGGAFLTSTAFSPDGKEIATSYEGSARIWSASTHRLLSVLTAPGSNSPVTSAAFSPDGKEIATASQDGTVRIWSASSHQLLVALTAPDDSPLSSVAFSPDGKEIVTASQDGTAQVWSTELAEPVQTIERIAERRVTRKLTPAERRLYNAP